MIGCEGSCMQGTCVNGSCLCNNDWSGYADLFTQDLTPWGGPVLNCPAHIPTLTAIWTTCLVLALILLVLVPFSIRQQWRKFKALQHEHGRLRWFRYYPLVYLLWLEVVVLPIVAATGAIKLASDGMSEVIGATPAASTSYALLQLLGPLIALPYLYSALKNFGSFGLEDASAAPKFHALVQIVSFFCVVGILVASATSVYPVVSVSRSPYSQRHVHLLCASLFFAQSTFCYAALSLSTALMGIKVVLSINRTISNRLDLYQHTHQEDLRASLRGLRRIRMKIAIAFGVFFMVMLTAVFMSCVTSIFPSLLLYASYLPAFVAINFPIVGMFCTLSYTDLPSISIWRLIHRQHSQGESAGPKHRGQQQGGPAANRDSLDVTEHRTPTGLTTNQDCPNRTVVDIAQADELEETAHKKAEVLPIRPTRWDDGAPPHLVV